MRRYSFEQEFVDNSDEEEEEEEEEEEPVWTVMLTTTLAVTQPRSEGARPKPALYQCVLIKPEL